MTIENNNEIVSKLNDTMIMDLILAFGSFILAGFCE